MSLQNRSNQRKTNTDAIWQAKVETAFSKEQEHEADANFYERELVARRIKEIGIKPKAVFKGKLVDDDKTKEYGVVKVDNRSGEVTLKNNQGTVRKINALDKFFGPNPHRGK